MDALIPELESIFERLQALQDHIGGRANEIERLGDDAEAVAALRADNAAKKIEYSNEIEKIGNLGGVLKDLDLRVVDFPATLDGERINLVWQAGERTVAYFREPGAPLHDRRRLPDDF